MGYTHYWYQSRAFTETEWTALTAEAKRICAEASKTIKLADAAGESGSPEFTPDMIGFNGLGDESYESFVLERAPTNPPYRAAEKEAFSFCKTARNSYDPVVVSVLNAAFMIAPSVIRISSDGGSEVFRKMF